MDRLPLNTPRTFTEVRQKFPERTGAFAHDAHLRLKDGPGGKVLFAAKVGTLSLGKAEERLNQRSDASAFLINAFKNEYSRYKGCIDRVLGHIDNDKRFKEDSAGLLDLKISNVHLMGAMIDNEVHTSLTIKQLSDNCTALGPQTAKQAAGDCLNTLNEKFTPEQRAHDETMKEFFCASVSKTVAILSADAIESPIIGKMFEDPKSFQKATNEYHDLILSGAVLEHKSLEGMKPFIVIACLLGALDRMRSDDQIPDFLRLASLPLGIFWE